MSAKKLTEYLVGAMDIAHLDAQGGAWLALELIEILEEAQEAGWEFTTPDDKRVADAAWKAGVCAAADLLLKASVSPEDAKAHWRNAGGAINFALAEGRLVR